MWCSRYGNHDLYIFNPIWNISHDLKPDILQSSISTYYYPSILICMGRDGHNFSSCFLLCCCWILISYFYILFGNSTVIFQVIRSDPWHDKYNPYGPENESLSSAASWKVIFLSLSHASSNLLMTDFQKKSIYW